MDVVSRSMISTLCYSALKNFGINLRPVSPKPPSPNSTLRTNHLVNAGQKSSSLSNTRSQHSEVPHLNRQAPDTSNNNNNNNK